jgi:putative ABC transport system ATP-binding protein/lipoprotein-releasing system ATP-binding protein
MSIVARHVGKVIGHPPNRVLSDITLDISDGEFVALTGRSGAGKSTLLYVLSSLDPVSSGTVEIAGRDIGGMREEELCRFRNELMGFVFQFHYLIAELSALENVLLPTRKTGQEPRRVPHARRLLEQFGLGDKLQRLPRELSGGEQQRVAIARALVMEPKYLFADEPTGNLDSVNGETVMAIIRQTNEQLGTTVIMVTHDAHYASLARRQIQLADGQLVSADRKA